MNLNKVFIIGRVTAQPELRTTPTGQPVSSFSVATNRSWTAKNGGRQEETEFHNIVVWGRQAEIAAQFLSKGGLVQIEGRLRTRGWQDKQGVNHKATEIICERFQLGPRAANSGGGASNFAQQAPASSGENQAAAAPASVADLPPIEELPIIDLEEEIKPEDIPF